MAYFLKKVRVMVLDPPERNRPVRVGDHDCVRTPFVLHARHRAEEKRSVRCKRIQRRLRNHAVFGVILQRVPRFVRMCRDVADDLFKRRLDDFEHGEIWVNPNAVIERPENGLLGDDSKISRFIRFDRLRAEEVSVGSSRGKPRSVSRRCPKSETPFSIGFCAANIGILLVHSYEKEGILKCGAYGVHLCPGSRNIERTGNYLPGIGPRWEILRPRLCTSSEERREPSQPSDA